MIVFLTLAGLLAALAAMLVLAGARGGVVATSAELEAERAALLELDRLKAEGRIAEQEWSRARAEAARRVLAVEPGPTLASGPRDRLWVLGGVALAAFGALALYWAVGSPGLPDQPFERRVDDWARTPEQLEPAQMAAVVARAVRERPRDHQALTMLGAARFQAGDPIGAAQAFRRALEVQPGDAQSWARLGESLVRANEGVVGGDAEAAFREALERDPGQLGARYFLGEAALGRNDLAEARAMWEPLIGALDPSDPRRADLQRRLTAAG